VMMPSGGRLPPPRRRHDNPTDLNRRRTARVGSTPALRWADDMPPAWSRRATGAHGHHFAYECPSTMLHQRIV
jgi:hypothetical protein